MHTMAKKGDINAVHQTIPAKMETLDAGLGVLEILETFKIVDSDQTCLGLRSFL